MFEVLPPSGLNSSNAVSVADEIAGTEADSSASSDAIDVVGLEPKKTSFGETEAPLASGASVADPIPGEVSPMKVEVLMGASESELMPFKVAAGMGVAVADACCMKFEISVVGVSISGEFDGSPRFSAVIADLDIAANLDASLDDKAPTTILALNVDSGAASVFLAPVEAATMAPDAVGTSLI